ncbi:MAG: GGDEF domain-containing protein [Arenimonas sp.]|uniref:GGDEF domain-containing protein n=1 Tax=Arenimonas sp. TaxID=1872635 RepID=UPI0025C70531|nr:GGDEF domain-containing protein [Arenimonas sp.]MBW8367186.1 GGDEF domain-containing protein [Arenimonas sp.]
MHRTLQALLLAATLCVAYPVAAAPGSPAFEAMLVQADQIRSTDPEQLQSLLGQMNASIDAASPDQKQQLQYLKAYHLAYTGRFDLAIEAAKSIFSDSTDVSLKFRAGALIVNSYAATRQFPEGLRYLDQTLALADGIQDLEALRHGWSAAGVIYNQVGQFEQGKRYADLMLADNPSDRTRCFAGTLRMEALYGLGPLTGEDTAIEALVQHCTATGEPVAANFARAQLARLWGDRGDHAKAISLLYEHLPEVESTRYPRLVGEIHSLLAEQNFALGYYDEADFHAGEAVRESAGIAHSLPLVAAYRVLYRSAMLRGDAAAALEHHIKFAETDKALMDSIKAREMAFQMVRNETQQKIQTIELLNKQNQVLTLERAVTTKTTQANRLLIALLAVLLASIGYWAYKVKRMQVSLRKLAETDALTGISNRHHFTRRATTVLEQCRKANEQVGLVMLDLDHFKSINDQYGHATGDWALREVAKACLQVCRRDDLLGRLGGEEFAFLLVGSDLEASAALARECRLRIASIDTLASGHEFSITASFGVAASRNCGHYFEALLAKADDALYQSKRDGRDRVSLSMATHSFST